MATSKSPKDPKVMDVSPPGSSAPPASAKPIIVSNRPMLKRDPMMASPEGGPEAEKPDATKLPVSRTTRSLKIISPVSQLKPEPKTTAKAPAEPTPSLAPETDKPTPATPATTMSSPAAKTEVAEDVGQELLSGSGLPEPGARQTGAAEPKPEAPSEAEPSPDAEPSTSLRAAEKAEPAETSTEQVATTDSIGDDGHDGDETSDQLAPNQALEEAKRKEAELHSAQIAEEQKIVASKQFYLPIANVEERRSFDRVLLVLVLVLLLTLVWADVMLDSGIIHINGYHTFTHFFSH